MFDHERLNEILVEYKSDFKQKQWPNEMYKWEAIKHFQDAWDVNAEDFGGMLEQSLAQCGNLLASSGAYPARMITYFAKERTEVVRSMFIDLFDESGDYYERIARFKAKASDVLLSIYGPDTTLHHYQTENVITTYLWLRYPDKYYIYKYSEARNVAQKLHSDYVIKQGAYASNLRNHRALYDEMCAAIKQDSELVSLLQSSLTPACYPDPELRTLTVDVGFYTSRYVHGQPDTPPKVGEENKYDRYDKAAFLGDVYMDEARYEKLRAVLLRKKNVILQGAPGVGKTFCARRLAWSIIEKKDDSRIEFVQFHQSYSYEDFVGGWRPEEDGFAWKPGVFYRFCKKAENQPDKPFFFIIDEINRGNLSRIFGELLMLIEADYRDTAKVTLPYGDVPFSVPGNIYIIGMMNTADRSLAMIDYALRRRFSFFEMSPAFDTEGFIKYRESLGSDTVDDLIQKVEELNTEIARDSSLGRGFCIGHSYFCRHNASEDADDWCLQVVDFDIIPMLAEYWFDDETKVMRWDNALHGAFQR